MAIPEIIEQLAHQVRTEIYGRDVREALATSMEVTAEVAEWSREVAQQIIDGSFDEGELNTEIERKLNELEQEYAPKLSKVSNKLIEEAQKNFYSSISSNRSVKSALTFIDDDARREVWTILKPFVEQKQIPFTSAVVTRRVETNNQYTLTTEEINELSRSGLWEFVSHTATHQDLRNISLPEVEQELKESRDWLLRQGFNADVIVYPYGGYNDDVIDLVGRYYRLGMNFNVITPRINNVPVESYKIQRIDFDFDIVDIKQCRDGAIGSDEWVV